MKRTTMLILTAFSALTLAGIGGCDREVSHSSQTTVKSNGTVTQKDTEVTQSPNGTVTKQQTDKTTTPNP